MENQNIESRKHLLVFCVAFPQDLTLEIKQTIGPLFNSTTTSIEKMAKIATLNEWKMFGEGRIFSFREKENSYDIFNMFQHIMHHYQHGKDQSIAYGVPHYGFDLLFVEIEKLHEENSIMIIDSYLLQNSFITNIEEMLGTTNLWLRGFYAQNAAVAELAKNMVQQNIKPAKQVVESEPE